MLLFFSQGYAGTPGPPGAPGERGTRVCTTAFISVLLYFFFLFPTSFWRMLYHLLVSLAVFHEGCRSILLSLLGGVLQKIPENSWGETNPLAWSFSVTFKENSREELSYLCTTKIFVKEYLLHSTIYLISFFKGAPGIFGTPGGDGDSGLAVSIYFFLPISSGRGGEGMKEKWKVLWA